MDIKNLIGRSNSLFESDLLLRNKEIDEVIKSSSFLVMGGGIDWEWSSEILVLAVSAQIAHS